MTEELRLVQGKTLNLRFVEGIVLEQETSTETRTRTTQNVGIVTQSGLVVGGGTNLHSTVIDKQQVWIRHDDGKEECVNFFRNVIRTRAGHRLLIALGGAPGKVQIPLAVYSYTEDRTNDFMDDQIMLLATGLHSILFRMPVWLLYIACVATIFGIVLIPFIFVGIYFRRQALLKSMSQSVLPRMGATIEDSKRIRAASGAPSNSAAAATAG